MSRCDSCAIPGFCCREIRLFGRVVEGGPPSGEIIIPGESEPGAYVASISAEPLPFKPAAKRASFGDLGHTWTWTCPRLDPTGRCGDYENRPQLCRDFEPETDHMCLHHGGAEGEPAELEAALLQRLSKASASQS